MQFQVGDTIKVADTEQILNGVWLHKDKTYKVIQKAINGGILIKSEADDYHFGVLVKEQAFFEKA